MTSLGFPGLSSQSVSVFFDFFGQKTPKRIGMTSLGVPGLSSQSVLRFLALFGQKTQKRTGTQGPYPSPFQGFLAERGKKPKNGMG